MNVEQRIEKHAGCITFWKTAKINKAGPIADMLMDVGMADVEIKERGEVAALKNAMTDCADKGVLVRPVKERKAHTYVKEMRGQSQNKYETQCTMHVGADDRISASKEFAYFGDPHKMFVGSDGNVIVMKYDGSTWQLDESFYFYGDVEEDKVLLVKRVREVNERYRYHRDHISGDAVRNVLTECVDRLGGVGMRDGGGVHHLPEAARERWGKVKEAVQDAALEGITNVFEFSLEWGEDTIADLKDVIAERLVKDADRVRQEIIDKGLKSEDALAARAEQIEAIQAKARQYKEILGDSLVLVESVVEASRQVAGHTASASEAAAYESALEL